MDLQQNHVILVESALVRLASQGKNVQDAHLGIINQDQIVTVGVTKNFIPSQEYLTISTILDCDCSSSGSVMSFCSDSTGQCPCKNGYTGQKCSSCSTGYTGLTCSSCASGYYQHGKYCNKSKNNYKLAKSLASHSSLPTGVCYKIGIYN